MERIIDCHSHNTGTTTPETGKEPEDDTTTDTDKPSDDNANAEFEKKLTTFIYVPEYIYNDDTHAYHNELNNIVVFDWSDAKKPFTVKCESGTKVVNGEEVLGYNLTFIDTDGEYVGSFFYKMNTYVSVTIDNYGIQKVMSQVDEFNMDSVIKTHQ